MVLSPGLLRRETAGTAERAAMISSALRDLGIPLGILFRRSLSPLTSIWKRSAEGLLAIFSLQILSVFGKFFEVKSETDTHPWMMISSFNSSRPFSISVTSTFLRQAFFPFLDGCLYCAGPLGLPEGAFKTGISAWLLLCDVVNRRDSYRRLGMPLPGALLCENSVGSLALKKINAGGAIR